MIDITSWMDAFLQALNDTFRDRVWFVGLQGSYARGEAIETSDIDVVVILEQISVCDIQAYDAMLNTLPHRELTCGFLSGKNEILNWEPSDLFQLFYDTNPIRGSLEELLPLLDADAVGRAISIGVCNIYHGCVHNMLYEKSDNVLRSLYKSASFVVQTICFRQTGRYIRHQKELRLMVAPQERAVIDVFLSLKDGGKCHFEEQSELLFNWSKKWITEFN